MIGDDDDMIEYLSRLEQTDRRRADETDDMSTERRSIRTPSSKRSNSSSATATPNESI